MAQDKQAPKKRRIVKSPETFRERAIKASTDLEKPRRGARLVTGLGRVTMPVTKPVGSGAKKITSIKPIRLVGRTLGRIILPKYLRSSFTELRQVKWPGGKTSRDLTFAVLAFAVAFGGVVALVDYGLDKVFRQILLK